jgi:hypothetical protein
MRRKLVLAVQLNDIILIYSNYIKSDMDLQNYFLSLLALDGIERSGPSQMSMILSRRRQFRNQKHCTEISSACEKLVAADGILYWLRFERM